MNQKIESPAELHADHRHWKTELAMWRDDIDLWQKEHTTALKDLEHAAELIRRHENAVAGHLDSLKKIEASLDYHEKNLANSLSGEPGNELDNALAERHQEQAIQIQRQRRTHEIVKKHHHTAIAHVSSLIAVLRERSEPE